MTRTVIIEGMTPAEFITAVNNNFYIAETDITDDMLTGDFITNYENNYDYTQSLIPGITNKVSLMIGMTASNFVNIINQNNKQIEDVITSRDFVGVGVKSVDNPLVAPANLQFYPPEVVLVSGVYYAFAKSDNKMLSFYSNSRDTGWGNEAQKLINTGWPFAGSISKYETQCLILKDGVWYLFYGAVLWEPGSYTYRTHLSMSSCNTINGTYNYNDAIIISCLSNNILAEIGLEINYIGSPEIVKIGSTYHWFFALMNEISNGVFSPMYITHATSPDDDWLNITFDKIIFNSTQVDSILTRTVTSIQVPRVFYYDGYYYMVFQASVGTDGDATNNQAGLYIARSLTIDGFDVNSIQLTPILTSETVDAWDYKRTYACAILRDNETKLIPVLNDGKLQIFYSGLSTDEYLPQNHGLPGFAELSI